MSAHYAVDVEAGAVGRNVNIETLGLAHESSLRRSRVSGCDYTTDLVIETASGGVQRQIPRRAGEYARSSG
jgi:hypothetical protein